MNFRIPIYKNLKDEQKIGYWTVFSNIVLVLVTFWLGLYVQDVISRRNSNASGILANVEYEHNVKPIVDSLNVKYGVFCLNLKSKLEKNINNLDPLTIIAYALNLHVEDIINHVDSTQNTIQNTVLSYCLDVAKANKKLQPYISHLNDDIGGLSSSIILMNDVYLFIFNQFYEINTTVEKNKGDYDSMYKSVKQKWNENWPSLKKQLYEKIRTREFLTDFGIYTKFDNDGELLIKKMYDGFIDDVINNCKHGIVLNTINKNPKGNNIKEDVLFMELYLVEEFAFMLNNLLEPAVSYHSFLSNNYYFRNDKKNTFIETPIKALILVVLVGVLLAWIILQTLPRNNTKDKKNMEDIYTDYLSELKYNAKLMNKLYEKGIEIPTKDEFKNNNDYPKNSEEKKSKS